MNGILGKCAFVIKYEAQVVAKKEKKKKKKPKMSSALSTTRQSTVSLMRFLHPSNVRMKSKVVPLPAAFRLRLTIYSVKSKCLQSQTSSSV